MPGEVTYDLTIGGQNASSTRRDSDRQLLSLMVELSMDGTGGRCLAELGDPEYTPPQPGDPFTVKLAGGNGETQVFKGEVEAVETTATSQRIMGSDGLVKLARLDLAEAYENVNVDFIVKDLMQRAGVEPGLVKKGPKLPSLVLFRGPRALRHIRKLAELCGVDLFTDGTGRAHFLGPDQAGEKRTFQYGENVVALKLKKIPPVNDGVEVWGEGAASSKGAEKYYWLPADLSGVQGKAALGTDGSVSTGKSGQQPTQFCSGALRSGDAAGAAAEARMKLVAGRLVQGHIKVFGSPAVMPGDLIDVEGLPAHHGATAVFEGGKSLRVRRVRHLLDMQAGFITRMDF
jgi:hypothetical protein